jgi:hypothetical protein
MLEALVQLRDRITRAIELVEALAGGGLLGSPRSASTVAHRTLP